MKRHLPYLVFAVMELLVVAFILATADGLPAKVASHFNMAGMADGFMPHQKHLQFMLFFAAGLPLAIVGVFSFVMPKFPGGLNIPHRDYWCSPENIDDTMRYLRQHIAWLGSLIAGFMGYIHWLVLKANAVEPPQMPNNLLFIGMGFFLIGVLLWGVLLTIKFFRLPKD